MQAFISWCVGKILKEGFYCLKINDASKTQLNYGAFSTLITLLLLSINPGPKLHRQCGFPPRANNSGVDMSAVKIFVQFGQKHLAA